MDEKKKFVKPEADVISLKNNDIITASVRDEFPDNWTGEDWGGNN